MNIMKDRNFKKYAIKGTKNLDQIFLIDNWARNTIKKMIEKNDQDLFIYHNIFIQFFKFIC